MSGGPEKGDSGQEHSEVSPQDFPLEHEFQCDGAPACPLHHWPHSLESTGSTGTCARVARPGPGRHSAAYLMREAALQHAVPGDLTQVARAQLPHLGCDRVFLHERLLECPEVSVLGGRRAVSTPHRLPGPEIADVADLIFLQ